MEDPAAVEVKSLTFAYPGWPPTVSDMSLKLPAGSRCLLCGANGAGKTTLLQVLAGKHLVGEDSVRVLGRPAFHDTTLTCTGELVYLGGTWRRDVACAGKDLPLVGDVTAEQMIFGVPGVDASRRDRLVSLLDVDLSWSMMRVSDGQRRRVQMCMGLLKPFRVLLMDEVTVDMDVCGRLDLLAFLAEECETRGAAIVYATHIFDGLEPWATHLAYVEGGALVTWGAVADLPGVRGRKLLPTVEAWLRDERNRRQAAAEAESAAGRGKRPTQQAPTLPSVGINGRPSKHLAYAR